MKDKIELPLDLNGVISSLSDEDAGQLFKAIFEYTESGTEPLFYNVMLSGIFTMIKIIIDSPQKITKKKPPAEKSVLDQKHQYGVNNNVLLTDDEYKKLQSEYSRDYQKRIDSLSSYIASSGKPYKSHYFTILNWSRRETGQDTPVITGGSFDTEEFCKLALAHTEREFEEKRKV